MLTFIATLVSVVDNLFTFKWLRFEICDVLYVFKVAVLIVYLTSFSSPPHDRVFCSRRGLPLLLTHSRTYGHSLDLPASGTAGVVFRSVSWGVVGCQ